MNAVLLFSFLPSRRSLTPKKKKTHFTHLYLVVIFLIVGLPIHAGKEVDAMGADQVDGAFALSKIKLNVSKIVSKAYDMNDTLTRVSLALLGTSMST